HRRIVCRRVVPRFRRKLTVERNPNFFVRRECEAFWHDADNGRRLAVDAYTFADDVGGPTEVALPRAIADNRDLPGARRVVAGREVAAHHRDNAEASEEVLGDVRPGVSLRVAVHRDVDSRAVQIGGQGVEGLLLREQLLEVHRRDLAVHAKESRAGGVDEVEADQTVTV